MNQPKPTASNERTLSQPLMLAITVTFLLIMRELKIGHIDILLHLMRKGIVMRCCMLIELHTRSGKELNSCNEREG